jgi:TATA-box binding protein (TBP) (component of TFIID and TFIIIB)
MSIYIDKNNEIHRYYLEIEKFLPQLIENPYINEVKHDIYNQKVTILKKHIDNKYSHYIHHLTNDTINIIFNKLYDTENFHILHTLFNEIQDNNIKQVNKFIQQYLYSNNCKLLLYTHDLQPTPIKISTMTVCCYLDQLIDINLIYTTFDPPFDINTHNFNQLHHKLQTYDIIGCKNSNLQKGYFKKNVKKSFFNSSSLNIFINKTKQINFKIFKNGKIQITGIPNEDIAKKSIENFILYLKKKKIIKTLIAYNNFRTVLINSDFFCGIQINRENFYKILTQKFNLNVSYESENYPGVKLGYFYNKKYIGTEHEGKCICENKCKGKGAKSKLNICKRITISTFQSGKIIITGASSSDHITCAYNFINKIISKHYYFIKKKHNLKIKLHKIKIKNITNYDEYTRLLDMKIATI